MRYFFSRLLLVAAPLLAWQCVELFVLPPNYFTFRPWEALRTRNPALFQGPFYPNQDIEMWTTGDLTPRGNRARHVRFRTDDFGYRNPRPYDGRTRYDFLVAGDSHFCGANLHERHTLAAVLEREYGKTAYNYASGWPLSQAFFTDTRFRVNPPRYVILDFKPEDTIQGAYATWPRCEPVNGSVQAMLCQPSSLWDRLLFQVASDELRILYDRGSKQLGYNFMRARMNLALREPPPVLAANEAEKNVQDFIDATVGLQDALRERGVKLILLLVPVPVHMDIGNYLAVQLAPKVPLVHWQSTSPYRWEVTTEPWYEENDSHMTKSSILKCAQRIIDLTLEL